MLTKVRRWFQTPHYDDPDNQRRAGYLSIIIWSGVFLLVSQLMIRRPGPFGLADQVLLGLTLLLGFFRFLLGRGRINTVAYGIIVSAWAALAYLAWSADGIRDITYVALIVVSLIAVLLTGWRGAAIVLGLTVLAGWGFAMAEAGGILRISTDSGPNLARDFSAVLVMIGLLIYLLESSLTRSLAEARRTASDLQTTNRELESLQGQLAQRVEERTAALEHSTAVANRRVEQLRAVSEVARRITAETDISQLLTEVTQLISEGFGYYHTGVFLIDETHRFVELRAANSQGGQHMLARRHRLEMDGTGIVATVAATGRPRIAEDVSQDLRFRENPDLPNTRSEMSLPLIVGERMTGVLDIQSMEPNAFSAEDVEVLQTLANQVAVAIENARLFDETRQALREVENAYRGFLRQEWASFSQQQSVVGAQYDGKIASAIRKEARRAAALEDPALRLPLVLHGNVMGELAIGPAQDGAAWTEDEKAVVRAAADRVAYALENARLVQVAQARAEREKAVADITNKIRATNDPQVMIETAMRELQQALGASSVDLVPANGPGGNKTND